MKALLTVARNLLLFPLWAAQLLTGAKSFLDNPLIGSQRLNRWGLHAWRLRATDRLAGARRRRLADRISAADREAFERDGYVVKRDFLPPAEFAALEEQVRRYRGEAREQVQGHTITRRIAYDAQTARAMPALQRLQDNPDWRGLIRYAGSFDAEPAVYVQTILSQALSGAPDPQEALHSDTFHSTVKAWLFLTEVRPQESCFMYVAGSHRLTAQRLEWEHRKSLTMSPTTDRLTGRGSFRIMPDELAALGLPTPTHFAVAANTLIVADTHGFHARQSSQRPSMRVEIWAYGRRNPFLPWTGADPWSLRALAQRRAPLAWRTMDLLERTSLARQVWRPRANTGAFDAA